MYIAGQLGGDARGRKLKPLGPALILGGLGQAGGLLASSLAGAGDAVTYADLRNRPDWIPPASYLQGDVTRPNTLLRQRIAASGCVVVCLPEEAALSAAPRILDAMAAGALWVDTLSVKSGICRVLRHCRRKIQMVSINPMFAPALGWRDHPVAVVEVASGARTRRFIQLLRSLGATVEILTAEAHDSLTAVIQVATHAAILSFGMLLLDLEYDVAKGLAVATPPHRLLLALLSRIVSANPEVYWDIQHHHPDGEAVRGKLVQAVAALDAAAKDSPAQFRNLLDQLRSLLSPKQELLQSLSDKMVAHHTPGTSK